MSAGDQPTVGHGSKQSRPLPESVATPLGDLGIIESFNPGSDDILYETSEVDVRTPLGRNVAAFHAGEDNRPHRPPVNLSLHLMGGSRRWGEVAGEPLAHGDGRIAWSAHAHLDILSGLMVPGRPVAVDLSEFDVTEKVGPFDFAVAVKDPGVEARVAAEVTALIEGWASADPGYAARIYAAMLRRRQADLERGCEDARRSFLECADARDEAARLARIAEDAASGRRTSQPLEEMVPPETRPPHIELRGFTGEPFDPRNVDEVVVEAPSMFHLETMSEEAVWMGVYMADGRRLVVNVRLEGKELKVSAELDDDGHS